jgi:aspartate/methionine/tyrosine aminotransferase
VKALAGILRDFPDVWILSDEIYSKIVYEGTHASIAVEEGMRDRTVLLDGFSKTYAMTGWRMGYGVMPESLAAWVARLATNCNSCTASFVQKAGVEALRGPQDEARRMRDEFLKRGQFLVEGLNRIEGIRCLVPQGAFYVFPDVRGLGLPSKEIEKRLLEEHGVAALSGTAFGAFGEGHIRFSYANSIENLAKALERVAALASSLGRGR